MDGMDGMLWMLWMLWMICAICVICMISMIWMIWMICSTILYYICLYACIDVVCKRGMIPGHFEVVVSRLLANPRTGIASWQLSLKDYSQGLAQNFLRHVLANVFWNESSVFSVRFDKIDPPDAFAHDNVVCLPRNSAKELVWSRGE